MTNIIDYIFRDFSRENELSLGTDLILTRYQGHQEQTFDYPVRMPVCLTSMCLAGEAVVSYDMQEYRIRRGDCVCLLPDHLVAFHSATGNFRALTYVFSRQFAAGMVQPGTLGIQLHLRMAPVVHLTDEEIAFSVHTFEMIWAILKREGIDRSGRLPGINREQAVKAVVNVSFAYLYQSETFQTTEEARPQSHRQVLFERFYDLVVTHHRQARDIIWYADKLCITPHYLSKVVKGLTGKSANQWINDLVILEAKSMLKHDRQKTVSRISDELGFPSQSHFARFFKKSTGYTPTQFQGL